MSQVGSVEKAKQKQMLHFYNQYGHFHYRTYSWDELSEIEIQFEITHKYLLPSYVNLLWRKN